MTGGGLIQLVAHGVNDIWYMSHNAGDALPYNAPQYNSCYYLHASPDESHIEDDSRTNDDGMMKKSDVDVNKITVTCNGCTVYNPFLG